MLRGEPLSAPSGAATPGAAAGAPLTAPPPPSTPPSSSYFIDGPGRLTSALQLLTRNDNTVQHDDDVASNYDDDAGLDLGMYSKVASVPNAKTIVASDNEVSNGFVKDGKRLPYVFEATESGTRKRSSKILPVCGVCGKRFVCVTTMKRHLVTHTGEKPFSCKICGKQYTQKGNLRVHERTHRNDRPFECNICHQKFYRKEPMQKHQWRQHGIVHFKSRPANPPGSGVLPSSGSSSSPPGGIIGAEGVLYNSIVDRIKNNSLEGYNDSSRHLDGVHAPPPALPPPPTAHTSATVTPSATPPPRPPHHHLHHHVEQDQRPHPPTSPSYFAQLEHRRREDSLMPSRHVAAMAAAALNMSITGNSINNNTPSSHVPKPASEIVSEADEFKHAKISHTANTNVDRDIAVEKHSFSAPSSSSRSSSASPSYPPKSAPETAHHSREASPNLRKSDPSENSEDNSSQPMKLKKKLAHAYQREVEEQQLEETTSLSGTSPPSTTSPSSSLSPSLSPSSSTPATAPSSNQDFHHINENLSVMRLQHPPTSDLSSPSDDSSSGQEEHQGVRSGDKELVECQCKACGNVFKVMDPYNFRCGNCHVKYTSLPTHMIADPLQCIGCCQVFPHKPALKAHQTCVDKERPFRCCKCGYGFRQKAHLQKHQWRIHRRKLEPDPNVKEAEALFHAMKGNPPAPPPSAAPQLQQLTRKPLLRSTLDPSIATITMQDIIDHGVERSMRDQPLNFSNNTDAKINTSTSNLPLDLSPTKSVSRGPESSSSINSSDTTSSDSSSPAFLRLRNLMTLPHREPTSVLLNQRSPLPTSQPSSRFEDASPPTPISSPLFKRQRTGDAPPPHLGHAPNDSPSYRPAHWTNDQKRANLDKVEDGPNVDPNSTETTTKDMVKNEFRRDRLEGLRNQQIRTV